MSKYLLKGEKLTLCCDPAACSYTVTFADKVWTMSESPFVLFSNDTSVPFPLPVCEEVYETGTSKCVKAVYKGFGESKDRKSVV